MNIILLLSAIAYCCVFTIGILNIIPNIKPLRIIGFFHVLYAAVWPPVLIALDGILGEQSTIATMTQAMLDLIKTNFEVIVFLSLTAPALWLVSILFATRWKDFYPF